MSQAPPVTESSHQSRPRRGPMLAVVAVALAVLIVAVVFVAKAVNGLLGGASDYTGDGSGSVVVQVTSGQTLAEIGQTLVDDHVVASVTAFTNAASENSRAQQIGPGDYRLHLHMSAAAAISLMLQPSSVVQATVVIPEGFTATAIANRLTAQDKISADALQAAIKDPSGLGLPAYAGGHVEGFLFPATYQFGPGASATDALHQMVARFDQEAAALHLAAGARAEGLTPYDVVILASIVQNEGRLPADFPKIARVFLNRIHDHMPLGSNATLAYVLHRAPTTSSDLHTDSPYNTEFKPGLPPTPINSPGEAALQAVLHPTPGPWLYFVTLPPDGHAEFANTEAGYQQLEAKLTGGS